MQVSETGTDKPETAPESAVFGALPAGSKAVGDAMRDAPDESGATISTDTVGVATGRTGGSAAGSGTESARGATSGDTAGGGPAPGATTAGRGAVAED
jgi:hypothetical protein